MKRITHDLRKFVNDPAHFPRLEIMLAVKSFDLQAIQNRYLKSRSRSRTGSVERRDPAKGGIVHSVIEDGRIVAQTVLAELLEPRGIDLQGDRAAVSSENRIFLFRKGENTPLVIEHPWLSYIHTVKFNFDGSRLLVSSSGVDTILEFETQSGTCMWEWVAWEHGLNEGVNPQTDTPHVLTRHPEQAEEIRRAGKNPLLVREPQKNPLPTALRAAFMNSAEYDGDGNVLATLFHAGQVMKIHRDTGKWEIVIDGLTRPHSGMRFQSGYLVTNTGGGNVQHLNEDTLHIYDFALLSGKPEHLREMEWLQCSRYQGNRIITVDSNRTALTLFDPVARKKIAVAYNSNWALQELAIVGEAEQQFVTLMKNWFQQQM